MRMREAAAARRAIDHQYPCVYNVGSPRGPTVRQRLQDCRKEYALIVVLGFVAWVAGVVARVNGDRWHAHLPTHCFTALGRPVTGRTVTPSSSSAPPHVARQLGRAPLA